MTRVLIQVVPSRPSSDTGVGWVVTGTARALSSRGYVVTTISADDVAVGRKGRQYLAMPGALALRARHAVASLPVGRECIVECHAAFAGFTPSFLRGELRRRCCVVFRCHGFWRAGVALAAADELGSAPKPWRTWKSELTYGNLERLAVRTADAVVVQSLHDARFAKLVDGIADDRLEIVPPGIDDGVDRWKGRGDRLELLWVGRSSLVKGSDVLFDMARILEARLGAASVRITCVGITPEEAPKLENVRAVGTVPRAALAEYFACADAFVWPSRFEGFGLAPFEAMAHGIPVISTRVGGLEGVLQDGQQGLVVDHPRPIDFADAVERFSRLSEASWRGMRHAARETARTLTWPSHGARLDAFYSRLLAQHRV